MALKDAAERTDLAATEAVIMRVRDHDEALADALGELARKYRFDFIQELFEGG